MKKYIDKILRRSEIVDVELITDKIQYLCDGKNWERAKVHYLEKVSNRFLPKTIGGFSIFRRQITVHRKVIGSYIGPWMVHKEELRGKFESEYLPLDLLRKITAFTHNAAITDAIIQKSGRNLCEFARNINKKVVIESSVNLEWTAYIENVSLSADTVTYAACGQTIELALHNLANALSYKTLILTDIKTGNKYSYSAKYFVNINRQ